MGVPRVCKGCLKDLVLSSCFQLRIYTLLRGLSGTRFVQGYTLTVSEAKIQK